MFRSSTSLTDSEAQVGFLFHVMIGVNPLGEFRAVRGLGRTIEHHEIKEGGRNHAPHLRVGPAKYEPCTIEWGMSNRTTLYDWIHAVEAGYGYKRQVWIIQLSRERTPLRIYQLIDAFPISWEGAELNANDNVVDTEQIKIVYEAVMLLTIPQVISNLPTLTLPQVDFEEDTGARTMAGAFTKVKRKKGVTTALDDGLLVSRDEPGPLAFTKDDETEEEEQPEPLKPVVFVKKAESEDEAAAAEGPEGLTLSGGAEVGAEPPGGPLDLTAEEKSAEDKGEAEADSEAADRPSAAGVSLSGGAFLGQTGAASASPGGAEGGSRPEPVKLKLSGGLYFAPTTFASDDE